MPTLTSLVLAPLLLPGWMDPETLIHAFGPYVLWGVAFVVFAECGLFAVLPGDSLLFTVGLLVAGGGIGHPMVFVCTVLTLAAVAGNVTGYWLGRVIGPPLFKPRRGLVGRVLDRRHVVRTEAFFDRYGNRALILARFVPVVRTFVTLVAGVGRMPFGRFITYTAIGGVLWACGVTTAGYYLGAVPLIRDNVDAVLVLVVVISVVPMLVEWWLHRRRAPTDGAATS